MMKIEFISIFPDIIKNYFAQGIIQRALKNKYLEFNYHNPRDYSDDKNGRIDDRPFGGGPGMLMQYAPLKKIADKLNQEKRPFHILLSPQGIKFNQQIAQKLVQKEQLALWCGRYEGIDQRFIDQEIDLEISIGDFILTGGELPACAIADTCARLVPNVLGHAQSAEQDSFQNQLLDHPHYTRPEKIANICAPEILLSGNHAEIARWRLKQSLGRTFLNRPDIFTELKLSSAQMDLLNEFLAETHSGEPS